MISGRSSVGVLVLVYPRIEIEAIEGNALFANRDHCDVGAHFVVKPVLVHTEVARCVSKP